MWKQMCVYVYMFICARMCVCATHVCKVRKQLQVSLMRLHTPLHCDGAFQHEELTKKSELTRQRGPGIHLSPSSESLDDEPVPHHTWPFSKRVVGLELRCSCV